LAAGTDVVVVEERPTLAWRLHGRSAHGPAVRDGPGSDPDGERVGATRRRRHGAGTRRTPPRAEARCTARRPRTPERLAPRLAASNPRPWPAETFVPESDVSGWKPHAILAATVPTNAIPTITASV